MITVHICTSADAATIAELWNSKTLDSGSCWYQVPTVDADYVAALVASGMTFGLALVDTSPAGFAFWQGPVESFQLIALAASADDVSYQLVSAYCSAGLSAGATDGWTEVAAGPSAEKTRMDSLQVDYTPIEWSALGPNDDPASRVPLRFRAHYDLATLNDTLGRLLGGGS